MNTVPPDAARVEDAVIRAAGLLRRHLPPAFPRDLKDAEHAAASWRERAALDARAEQGAIELLDAAVQAERDARAAQEAAVEALRHLRRPPSWVTIGERVGLSPQGAHKRFRDVERPLAQTTIDQALADG